LNLNNLPETPPNYEHVKKIDRQTEASTDQNETNVARKIQSAEQQCNSGTTEIKKMPHTGK